MPPKRCVVIFYPLHIFILAAEREAQIEAFLDQIEGETLGEMMNYLSSELESTNFGHHDAAAAALQSTTSGGDENASSDIEKKSVTNGDVVIMSTKKDKNEEEKIYSEITKLTRSTVDRYVGLIFTLHASEATRLYVNTVNTRPMLIFS